MDFDDIHTELKGASKAVINKVRKKTALENVMEGLVIARKAPKRRQCRRYIHPSQGGENIVVSASCSAGLRLYDLEMDGN